MAEPTTLQVVHEELTTRDVLDAQTGEPLTVTVPSGRRWRGTFLVLPGGRHDLVRLELQLVPDGPWQDREIGPGEAA